MKYNKLFSTLLLLISIISFSSCIGDKGNVLQSYDVGTVIENNGEPIIKTDNIHINLTGAGLDIPQQNVIDRCLFTFTLDWDNQPEGAYEKGIYTADIAIQEKWIAEQIDNIANNVADKTKFISSIPPEKIVEEKSTALEESAVTKSTKKSSKKKRTLKIKLFLYKRK